MEQSQIIAMLDGMDPFEDLDDEEPYLEDSNSGPEPEDVGEDESSFEVGDAGEGESSDESEGSESQRSECDM